MRRNTSRPRGGSSRVTRTAKSPEAEELDVASAAPEAIVGRFSCDACGAAIQPYAQKCEYCGSVPVILIKGIRLSVLIARYLETNLFEDAHALAGEILRDYPLNCIAWATKGLCMLRLGTLGPLGIRNVTADDIDGAVKCFSYAGKGRDGLIRDLRSRGASECMRVLSVWIGVWRQAYADNAMSPLSDVTKRTFICLHKLAGCAASLDPASKSAARALLAEADESMECAFSFVWPPEGKNSWTTTQRSARKYEREGHRSRQSENLFWASVGAAGVIGWLLVKILSR